MRQMLLPTFNLQRIQRRRVVGWRMPDNTVYVGRPTLFGNPFQAHGNRTPEQAVSLYRKILTEPPSLRRHGLLRIMKGMEGRGEARIAEIVAEIPTLRGKNLCCWCPLDQPCHADVLLELANAEVTP